MCEAVMSGFNACLFAYGQTGSGKSYSMIGSTDALSGVTGASPSSTGNPSHSPSPAQRDCLTVEMPAEHGIMPRLCSDLFRLMREEREKEEGVTHSVELSFLEIYCEKVHDLIAAASSITAANSNSSYVGTSASLRIRQHPSRGPYVEGLSHVKVRDAGGVIKHLLSGLRARATAETNMNEHSSRSHAILQLHITKVLADTDESTGSVITRTRTCKVNMVDLAGSERVSQSGVSGDRLEEAKNINLSLSTLGRVIQQLSEKQAGKNVIPAYRDSMLTWLLSDSLGGNSKTIMLATVAPSAYCYQQTLNTLRFAGVAKKIVNVATVNEDRHFQELIAELRRQIVRLTLQLESGKAAEVHLEKIDALKREREALLAENDALKMKVVSATDTAVLQALRKRVKDLEAENAQLGKELQGLQGRMLTSTSALRDELAKQRAEVMQLYEKLTKREAEVTSWANRYRALVISTTTPSTAAASAAGGSGAGGAKAVAATAGSKEALRAQQQLQEELKETKAQLQKAMQDLSAAERAKQEAIDATKMTATHLDEYRVRYEENKRQLELLHERMQSTMSLLETTQCELSAVKSHSTTESAKTRAVEDALEATNTANVTAAEQLEQMRNGYLEEKQRNVQLLLRVAQVEQERSALKRAVTQRTAEMCELEQLLLEETETSERYYMRMRFHRSEHELQHQCMVQLLQLRGMADHHRSADGLLWSAASTMGAFPSPHPTLRPGEGKGGRGTPEVPSKPLYRDPNSANAPSTSAAHEAATSEQLLHMQLEYECQLEELQARAAMEQECAAELAILIAQKARLGQIAAAELSEKLVDAEDAKKVLREELHYYKQKVETREKEYAEEVAQHQSDNKAMQNAEMERMRWERKVGALEEANAELEAGRNLLIAKVAQLQDQQSMWQTRCAEAERISAEVQDLLFPGSYGTSSSSPANRAGEGDGDSEDQLPKRRSYSALQLEASILANKVREAESAMDARAALERQCEEYRGELGALRAQVDQMKSQTQAAQQQRARSDQAQQHVQTHFGEVNAQLVQEISIITRDYESRIKQQQAMMKTLRHALDEETFTADMCRQSAQRAEAARQAQEEELLATREAAEELRCERETTTKMYLTMQAELNELRTHYHALERQLMELREREPALYVLLEKGLDEDTTSWLEKVRGEKLRLQKQRHEAQRLNSKLLEQVQDSNTRLRDVQKQLTDASIGGDKLAEDEEVSGN
ncbi:putative kinesin [Leishmania mexicana MHOM/GT/2001/U1103]|uniref:Kinesin n=1 Tax=Leishmania mexicana (strain MHOM/GT/2001/U1103) TaxID=929439 RepID=E9AVS8_LEIMU|nr:putative kinesin [Leishmania mexicana MHOM/GT/2001/U1103]CBZ27061.1 putative kinesin [Leishmania mexicana MHOM/GT/2001/U1103]